MGAFRREVHRRSESLLLRARRLREDCETFGENCLAVAEETAKRETLQDAVNFILKGEHILESLFHVIDSEGF